jgi:bifunctional enzyme CysN/CysC
MQHLEGIELGKTSAELSPFRMPVQFVNRPNLDFRGFSGKIAAGIIHPNDEVRILPSGKTSHVGRIVTMDGDLDHAVAGQSVTLTLKDEVDCSRGQIITTAKNPLEVADQFEATVIWMEEADLIPGRPYYLKIGTQTVSATVARPKYQINVNTLEHIAVNTLSLNAIGVATITTDRAIPLAAYEENRELGGFILIDKITNATVGAGLIKHALRRAQNIHWQAVDITAPITLI